MVEAQPVGPVKGEALWRFDFRGTEGFVSGSIRVESGQVVSRGGRQVVFRVSEPGERLKFTFDLAR